MTNICHKCTKNGTFKFDQKRNCPPSRARWASGRLKSSSTRRIEYLFIELCWEESWDVVGLQNTNFPVCSSCSPGLFFGPPCLQGICRTFLGSKVVWGRQKELRKEKAEQSKLKYLFPSFKCCFRTYLRERKTLTIKHHLHYCANTTNTTKNPTTFSTMRVWQRFIRHASRRPQKVVFVIWTFGKEIVVKEYLTIRDIQYFP